MRWRDEKKWKTGNGDIDKKKMDEDMGIMFRAVDENYKMAMQYKYTWNTLQNFGQFRDKRIWKNFTYFIDWMEKNFEKEKFFEVMGKSYDLEDSILYRIQKTEDKKKSGKDGEAKKFETWLMSNVFRHVENPKKEKNPQEKYIGKVKFTKKAKVLYQDDDDKWTPPTTNENGEDAEERKEVDDIEIIVYSDDDMQSERKYEEEHGWKKEWVTAANRNEDYNIFVAKWNDLKNKMKVPGWYHFNPEDPENPPEHHNKMKEWDETMFKFLKDQKWKERMAEKDKEGRNQYEEKSSFVVNCSQLLGIGGEAVVIRKAVSEKVGSTPEEQRDREYEALKIIPIMKHNFEDEEKVKEMESRVNARHEQADPEKHFPGAGLEGRGNQDRR